MNLVTADAHYGAIIDRNFNQPWTYGGGSRLPSLAFCQRFNRDAHYADVADAQGIAHWVTQKQMRVYGIIARIALSEDGRALMKDIAAEAQCHPTTVSRAILKFQAWGLYAVDVRRGRHGGITVWKATDSRFALYAKAARQKLRELARRAWEKLHPRSQGEDQAVQETVGVPSPYRSDMDATFTAFARRVLLERAYLALEDPDGERESISPLDENGALRLIEQVATVDASPA